MYTTLDLLTPDYIRLSPASTISEVLQAFIRHRTDIACVVDADNKLLGVVTKYMIYRQILKGTPLTAVVKPFYRSEAVTLSIDDDFNAIRDRLLSTSVAHAVVVDGQGTLHGVISKADLIRALHLERDIFINRLDVMIENLPIGILAVDKQRIITHSNKTTTEMLGLTYQSMLDRPLESCFPELNSLWEKVCQTKQKLLLQKIRVRNLNCVVSFIPLFEPELETVLIMLQELSSLENLALELKTTQSLFNVLQTILDTSYDCLMVTDLRGRITSYSRNLSELIDISTLKTGETNISELIPFFSDNHIAMLPDHFMDNLKVGKTDCLISVNKIKENQEINGYVLSVSHKQIGQKQATTLQSRTSLPQASPPQEGLLEDQFDSLRNIVSVNPVMKNIKRELPLIAKTGSSVLVLGESGTGKELIANAVHELSGRNGNFIKINCAAIPLELLESELFGYEEGAFTGARKGGKPGRLELSDKGTMFLDEIGDMPMSLQAKLLRVVEEKCFERIGSTKTITSDVRFIAATNKDLKNLMLTGRFREDLYYRLNVIRFELPPLRQRLEDIPFLVEEFLHTLNTKYQKNIVKVSSDVKEILIGYQWPGNIRELFNAMERAVIWCNEPVLSVQHLSFLRSTHVSTQHNLINSTASLSKEYLVGLLQKYNGNKSKVAGHLGVSRVTLYKLLKASEIMEKTDYI